MSASDIAAAQLEIAEDVETAHDGVFGVAIPLVAIGLFVLHAMLLGTWFVDDAGISFAYARNLAHGYGLTAQPGVVPVEGYSNLLWLLLLSVFYFLHAFNYVVTPKVLALILTGASFTVLSRALSGIGQLSWRVVLALLCLIALQPAFVIWSVSGLENPLYVFLIASLFAMTLSEASDPAAVTAGHWSRPIGAALLACAIAATRPDGILYASAYPGVLVGLRLLRARSAEDSGRERSKLLTYALSFAVLWSLLVGFRLIYFHDLFPNTYYAKGAGEQELLFDLLLLRPPAVEHLAVLIGSVTFTPNNWAIILLSVATVYLIEKKAFNNALAVMLAFLFISIADYLLLPDDWMGEFRFATPFYVFWYLYGVSLIAALIAGPSWPFERWFRRPRWLLGGVIVGIAIVGSLQLGRTLKFRRHPTVPLAMVRIVAQRYNRCAELVGILDGSILLPDVGGMMLDSKLRVYDLGKLCDRTIARTLGKNQPAFYDYVFDLAKPTFIHVHGVWARLAHLDDDPRLRRDYLLIRSRNETGEPWRDYVRRSALAGRTALLPKLDAALDGA